MYEPSNILNPTEQIFCYYCALLCLRSKNVENITNITKTLPFNLVIPSVDNIVLGYIKTFPFCFCLNLVVCHFCTEPKELT